MAGADIFGGSMKDSIRIIKRAEPIGAKRKRNLTTVRSAIEAARNVADLKAALLALLAELEESDDN